MKRRKFELWVADMRRFLADPTRQDRRSELWQAAHSLYAFEDLLVRDTEKMSMVNEVLRSCRSSSGPGRTVAEARLLDYLVYLAQVCVDRLEEAGVKRLPDLAGSAALTPEAERICSSLHTICDSAFECLRYKAPRDSFSGVRRGKAFEMLTQAGYVIDLPEAVSLARQAIHRGGRGDAPAAAEFIQEYFQCRGKELDEETVDALLHLSGSAYSRCVAVGALRTLAATNTISEFEALNRLDDRKEEERL